MWHINRDGKSTGPFSEHQIKQLLRERRVLDTDLVWKQGMKEWSTAAAVFGIKEPKLPPIPPRVPDASSEQGNHSTNPYGEMATSPAPFSKQTPSSETSKLGAALLAIFLGGLGIHKFYLGYQTAGIIMLAITLLSCGFGVFVIGIVGIIEGIIYISKSDEEFYLTYVTGRKEWF